MYRGARIYNLLGKSMATFSQNQELNRLLGQESPNRMNQMPGNSMLPSLQTQPSQLQLPMQQGQGQPQMRAPQTFAQPINNQSSWWDYLFGSQPQQFGYNQYTPEQQQLLNYLAQSSQQQLQNPYEGFDLLQNQIMDTYNQQILPESLERFNALTGGAPSSFSRQIRAGNQGLAQQLLQHKLAYGQQQKQQALQQAQIGLRPQFETGFVPGQQGFFPSVLGRAIPAGLNLLGLNLYGGI